MIYKPRDIIPILYNIYITQLIYLILIYNTIDIILVNALLNLLYIITYHDILL